MNSMLTQPRPIRLKGRSFLALALTPDLPFEDWLVRLDDLAARSAGFFLRRPVVLDVGGLDIDRPQLRELIDQLGRRNVRVMGIEGARASLLAGFMGAAASAGWLTAFAIEPVAHVRTLGLVELVFSYAVSRKLFREKLTPRELCGMALLAVGVVLVLNL